MFTKNYTQQQVKINNMISNCCGASDMRYEDYGICPDCKEHCEFINEDEDEYDAGRLKS